MGPSAATEHKVGRPRSAEADEAIHEATAELLADDGYAGLTMSGVAHRAGVSTATLYRRWSSKLELVVDVLAAGAEESPVPDTGTLEGDVRALLQGFVERSRTTQSTAIMAGLIGEVGRNPDLAEALRSTIIGPRRSALNEVFHRARDRGELRTGVDIGIASDLLFGPLYHRLLVTGEPVTARVADKLGDLVLAAIHA
ncbi:MAG: TetR/AcrR family transcriptional regulator [Acidimicrobiia bacterium]|nr:TetR/AcrR family transcriptional regulator [Acidimicrobiia bacterium]